MPFNFLTPGFNPQAQAPQGLGVDPRLGNLFDYQDPAGMGLLAAGASLLQAGAPSTTKQGIGAGIGQGLMSYVQGQQQARRSNVLNALQGTQLSELLRQQTQRAQLSDAIKKGLADPNSALNKTVPEGLKPLLASADPSTALSMIGQASATQQAQGFSRETLALQQDFAAKQAEVQRAHAATMQDNSFANQAKLQAAQQAFTGAQAALNRSLQSDLAKYQVNAPLEAVPSPSGVPGETVPRATAESYAKTQGALPAELAAVGAKTDAAKLAGAFGNADKLRDEYNTLTKDFRTVSDAYDKIINTAATGAGDMAMLYNFVKLLDPGSVVRESEFETAAASGSYGQRIQGAVQRAMTGQRLPDNLRKDFLREAKTAYDAHKRAAGAVEQTYRGLAKRFEIDPDTVIAPYTNITAPQGSNQSAASALPALPPGFNLVPQ